MTKVKKLLKKAFTLVELVVVVAIIAILSGVSVAAYVGITDRANKAADQDEIAQLNLHLAAQEAIEGKNGSCFEAIKDVAEAGLDLESMTPHTKNSQYVWDQQHDRFAIINEKSEVVAKDSTFDLPTNKLLIWKLTNTLPETGNQYSIYLRVGSTVQTIDDLKYGLDVGANNEITSITYTGTSTDNVVIRTNSIGTSLTINTPDTAVVSHYGIAGDVIVQEVSNDSYYEYGIVRSLELKKGHVSLKSQSTVYRFAATGSSDVFVSKEYTANLYNNNGELITEAYDRKSSGFETPKSIDTCLHSESTSIIYDSRNAYEICHECGATLVNLYIDPTQNTAGHTGNVFKRVIKTGANQYMVSPMNGYLFTRTTLNNIDPHSYTVVAENVIPFGYLDSSALTGEPCFTNPLMTEKQGLCKHESLTHQHYDVMSHMVVCPDCGYEFQQFHDENCLEHVWDPVTHTCIGVDHKDAPHAHSEDLFTRGSDADGYHVCVCAHAFKLWGNNPDYIFNGTDEEFHIQFRLKSAEVSNCTSVGQSLLSSFNIRKVVLDEGIEEIGLGVFSGCEYLKVINLPSTLRKIGPSAFEMCPKLRTIRIPNGVTNLSGTVFYYSTNIEWIYLPKTVTTMCWNTFAGLLDEETDPIHTTIIYDGTKADWYAISKGNDTDPDNIDYYINCDYPNNFSGFTGVAGQFRVQCSDGLIDENHLTSAN